MSNKRVRTLFIGARVSPAEHATITSIADCHGMSPGALFRQTILGIPPPPGRRRPTVNTKLMLQALAQIGKIGSNINQIAYHLNAGRPGDRIEGALDDALRELLDWRTLLMQALGAERHRKDSN